MIRPIYTIHDLKKKLGGIALQLRPRVTEDGETAFILCVHCMNDVNALHVGGTLDRHFALGFR